MHKFMFAITIVWVIITFPSLCQEKNTYTVEAIAMKDCLIRAIRHNLDLEIEGYNPKIREFDLMLANSDFDPSLISSVDFTETKKESKTVSTGEFDIGLKKKHILGGTVGIYYTLDYNATTHTDSAWTHGVSLVITQPLLRNLGIDANLASARLAENAWDQSYYDFQDKAISVLSSVQTAYWNLVNARANYELQRKSLELTENLFKITQARIKAGSLAAADILDVERNLASKRDSLVSAEKSVADAEDSLKQLIRPLDLNYYKNIQLVPTERPIFSKIQVDFDESLRYALENRPDIRSMKIDMNSAEINIESNKNKLLPKLDLSATVGVNGSEYRESDEAWKNLTDGDYPYWQVTLSLEIPLGNRAAKSKYMRSLLEKKQTHARYRSLENQIIIEIRTAIRELETSMRRVETAQITRELAEKQLANEENKFRAGIITLFQVQDTEQKLTEARITESNALLDFQRALVKVDKAKGSLLRNIEKYGIPIHLLTPSSKETSPKK